MKAGFKYLVNPLVGCNRHVLEKIENRFPVDPAYRAKYRRSKAVSRILHELARFDRIRYRSMRDRVSLDIPPVFIIGHWRSGTSFLHNLLCQVYPAAYTTTYHAAFPNNLFAFRGLVKFFMKVFLPRERPTDAMKMHPDLPQEEEIALGQERFFSFYYWFYFPRQAPAIAEEFLYLGGPEDSQSAAFAEHYREFIQRCLLHTRGKIFISKNPANTARIAILADRFPDARFIYLKRDPYETLNSSLIFFKSLINGVSLQECRERELECFVVDNYKRLVSTYLETKELIPPDQLIELSYEELIKQPAAVLSDLTERLNLGVGADLSGLTDYQAESRNFPRRQYRFKDTFLDTVNDRVGNMISQQGYSIRQKENAGPVSGK
jgi:hypothetical protein